MIEFLLTLAILAGINVLLASGFNLILGYGGLVSVAQPVFYALGAYSSALLSMHLGVPVPVAIIMGALISAIASFGLSLPSLRVSGDYLVIASLGFQLGIIHIINNIELTGAASGLSGIVSITEGPYRSWIYAGVIVVVAALVILAIRWLVTGPYGRVITAMRNDEDALAGIGRNGVNIKVALFALGSGIAGLAGGLYAHYFLFLSPEQFGIFASATLLTMVVVGGAATVRGPVLGAILLTLLPEAIRFVNLPVNAIGPLQGVFFTGLVIIFLFTRPEGLFGGKTTGGLQAWRGRRPAATTSETK
jgi:branched-chain amino acid transport system permease protein